VEGGGSGGGGRDFSTRHGAALPYVGALVHCESKLFNEKIVPVFWQ